MKKQIFILTFFVLAILAGTSTTWAQVGADLTAAPAVCAPARPIECLEGDALHPIPGTPYTYSVTVPNIVAGTGEYFWMITQEQEFITDEVLTNIFETPGTDASHALSVNDIANYGSGVTGPGVESIEIIWKSFVHDPDNPVFVVIQVTGTDADDCPINNLKVYMIEPQHAFTLDIASVNLDGTFDNTYTNPAEQCFPPVWEARYDGAGGVLYDYGVSYLYYIITAANFTEEWRASLLVAGLETGQTLDAIDWQYLEATVGTWTPATLGGALGAGQYSIANVEAQDASGAVGASGECILVRVTISHNNWEGIVAQTITLAVDGETELASATPLKDLHHDENDADCGQDDNYDNDVAGYVLTPRPDIQTNTPGVEPPYEDPGPFLPNSGPANP